MSHDVEDIDGALYRAIDGIFELRDMGVAVYNDAAPDEQALPYVLVGMISDNETNHMKGTSEIGNPQYQVDVYARSGRERFKIFKAIRNNIVKIQGKLDQIPTQVVRITGGENIAETKKDGSMKWIYRRRIDLEVWWKKPAPSFQ